jgi:hypothetical protein
MFIHHVDTTTALNDLTGMFKQRFGCAKLHFRSKLSCKATCIPRIIGASMVHIGFTYSFSEGRPAFVEAAWDYQNLQNIR